MSPRSGTAVVLGGSAAVLTFCIALNPAPMAGDEWLARQIQRAGWFEGAAGPVNALGDGLSWVAVLAAMLAVITIGARRGRAWAPGLATLVTALVLRPWSSFLKALVDSPRPSEASGLAIDRFRDNPGFPSGHVYADVLFYGAIAWAIASVAGRPAGLAAVSVAILIAVLAGPSRIFVGAHWPSDVAGGYLWGGVALVLATESGRAVRRRWAQAPRQAGSDPGAPGG